MKFKDCQPDSDNNFFTMVDASKDDFEITSDSFSVIATHLREWSMRDRSPPSKVRVWCREKNGFSYRDYMVASLKPLKMIPEGGWRHAKIPEEPVAPAKPGQTMFRQEFVPHGCDPGDVSEFGYLKGQPVDTGTDKKWEIRGVSTGTIYKSGIATQEEAWEIMKGQKPYREWVESKAA